MIKASVKNVPTNKANKGSKYINSEALIKIFSAIEIITLSPSLKSSELIKRRDFFSKSWLSAWVLQLDFCWHPAHTWVFNLSTQMLFVVVK